MNTIATWANANKKHRYDVEVLTKEGTVGMIVVMPIIVVKLARLLKIVGSKFVPLI